MAMIVRVIMVMIDKVLRRNSVANPAITVMNRGMPLGDSPPDYAMTHDSPPPDHPCGAVPGNTPVDGVTLANGATQLMRDRLRAYG